jgi:hypothetical protein
MTANMLTSRGTAFCKAWNYQHRRWSKGLRIPIEGGHVFRFDGGHRSNMIPATIPI